MYGSGQSRGQTAVPYVLIHSIKYISSNPVRGKKANTPTRHHPIKPSLQRSPSIPPPGRRSYNYHCDPNPVYLSPSSAAVPVTPSSYESSSAAGDPAARPPPLQTNPTTPPTTPPTFLPAPPTTLPARPTCPNESRGAEKNRHNGRKTRRKTNENVLP